MGEAIQEVGELAGICGHDGTNWEKVLIDASKRLVVAIASIVASDVQLHGYYDGAWQKAPIPWGYCDVISETVDDTNLDAGTNYLQGTVVPSGEVWFVTIAAGRYEGAAGPNLFLGATIDGVTVNFFTQINPTTSVWYGQVCQCVLKEGDKMQATITGAAAGDNGRFRYAGYKVDLDL